MQTKDINLIWTKMPSIFWLLWCYAEIHISWKYLRKIGCLRGLYSVAHYLIIYPFFSPSGWFWSFSYKYGKSFLQVRLGHFYAYADLSCTFVILAQEIHRFLPPLSHSHLDSSWFLTGVFVNWLESMWAGVSSYFWLLKFGEYSFSLRV